MSIYSIKFHKDLISGFWVILLTDRQTDRQRWKHDLLGGAASTRIMTGNSPINARLPSLAASSVRSIRLNYSSSPLSTRTLRLHQINCMFYVCGLAGEVGKSGDGEKVSALWQRRRCSEHRTTRTAHRRPSLTSLCSAAAGRRRYRQTFRQGATVQPARQPSGRPSG